MFNEFPYKDLGDNKIKLELDPIKDDELPYISIVTPFYNRYKFMKLMMRNYNKIDYPKKLIEWIIIDDSTDNIGINMREYFKGKNIRYIKMNRHITIGAKRNLLAKEAKYKYIVHMDDDDWYPSTSVIARIRALLKLEKEGKRCLVGCSKVNCYNIISDVLFEAYDVINTISESTMAYSKEYFNEQGFNNKDKVTECLNFIKNRENTVYTLPSTFIITQITHGGNTINRNIINDRYNNDNLYFIENEEDKNVIFELKCEIIRDIPEFKETLNIRKKLKKDILNFFNLYDFCNYNDKYNNDITIEQLMKCPLMIELRREYKINKYKDIQLKLKEKYDKRIINYYCGPGKILKFSNKWSPYSNYIGGSEEAVINLSKEFIKENYIINIYCNLDEISNENNNQLIENGIFYRNYWEWIPQEFSDITIIWRDPTNILDNINSNKIFLDLHDHFSIKDIKYFNNINPKVIIMTKSNFQKQNLSFIKNNIILNIPNGIHIYNNNNNSNNIDINNNKKINMLITTSSYDRCLRALLDAIPIIKKEIPDINLEIHWAYGFNFEYRDKQVMDFINNLKFKLEKSECINHNRLSQDEINKLYKDADLFIYGTNFPEIDCISLSKAFINGTIPIVTDAGSLKEKMINFPELVTNLTSEYNTNDIDKSISGIDFDNWINNIIKILKDNNRHLLRTKLIEEGKKYDIELIAKKWLYVFNL